MKNSEFVYGKDQTKNIVSVAVNDCIATIYTEDENGISKKQIESRRWVLFDRDYTGDCTLLDGGLHYRYGKSVFTDEEFYTLVNRAKANKWDFYTIYNPIENFMVKTGVTAFNGMDVKDVSVLSFDIETTGLVHNADSEVLLISATHRFMHNGEECYAQRLFSIDEHENQYELINAFCIWVRTYDPSVIIGHNIIGYDLPYLEYCYGQSLPLGRDGSDAKTARYTSQFRKDGSQSYDYKNILIHGREIVDTFFLSIKYDVARNYPSYRLKEIISYEGLERGDRQFYEAANIKDCWDDPIEREKIKEYCIHDADDALALYDLMIPPFFYHTQSMPRTLQHVINSATGGQINAFLVRSYLSNGHSIPKAEDQIKFQGGISYGNPGIYENVGKVDIASQYPSIIRKYKIFNTAKDPKGNLLRMVEIFTDERLENKRLAKETGIRKYQDLSDSQKITINSVYGTLGTPFLNFNSFKDAATITRHGREMLQQGIDWAEENMMQIVNVDTDSFSFTFDKMVKHDLRWVIPEINGLSPEGIVWEDDGFYEKFIVVKAKNYIMKSGDKVTIKGSGLKATMKEPALKEFIGDVINNLLGEENGSLSDIYLSYTRRINSITICSDEIAQWSSKKTITKSVLNPKRTTEERIKAAYGEKIVNEGDKIHVFFKTPTELCLAENFDGAYDKPKLYEKLYKTIKIFETIVDLEQFPNFKLKRNKELLENTQLVMDVI